MYILYILKTIRLQSTHIKVVLCILLFIKKKKIGWQFQRKSNIKKFVSLTGLREMEQIDI